MQNQYQEFFKQTKFGLEFEFNRLAQVTSAEFAKAVDEATAYNYIKKMDVSHNTYTFYVEDMEDNFNRIITAYYNKEFNSFTVDVVYATTLKDMGLQITKVS